jgi:molybdate transport system substrate-binding protein
MMRNALLFGSGSFIGGLAISIAAMAACPTAAAAQLDVMISAGFSPAYREALPEFERSTGITVATASAASQGTGSNTIAAQLRRGVHADVVILAREGLNELIEEGRIVNGTEVDLARVPLGAAVRAGTPKPDLGTVEAFKRALLDARLIVVASTSGIYLTTEIFPRLGIADKISVKVVSRSAEATSMVAAGDADIAVLPVSAFTSVPGIEFAGRVPNEAQLVLVFTAATVSGSNQPAAAKRLIEFLASERTSAAIEKSGMEPVGKRSMR